ncbi:5'(3')-deoxyribonucleotidase [Paenibacillus chartarius]|uniref:5'(3')-deoxyribonucleotidase n=1 Tax=Paenibacillus chartarius TaxID=747481 RepID=A0ABV6DKD8_9BACL
MRLLIDMDSVIVDLMSVWFDKYNADYNDHLSVDALLSWNTELYVKPECGEKIYEYLDETGLFRALQPLPHAIDVLQRLKANHDIVIVSSSRTHAFSDKEFWVEQHLPFIGKTNLIFSHRKELICGDLLFDDAPHNLKAFSGTGRLAVAMDYPYNRDVKVPRVSDWLEFEKFVNELKGSGR